MLQVLDRLLSTGQRLLREEEEGCVCSSVLLRLQCIYAYLVIEPVLKLVYPSHELKLLSRVLQPLSTLLPQLDQLSIPGRGVGGGVGEVWGGGWGGWWEERVGSG